MVGGEAEGCLVHRVSGSESYEDAFWEFRGECREELCDYCGVSADHVGDCYADSDFLGVGGDRGECCEWFGCGCGLGPVEEVVVDDDRVEA